MQANILILSKPLMLFFITRKIVAYKQSLDTKILPTLRSADHELRPNPDLKLMFDQSYIASKPEVLKLAIMDIVAIMIAKRFLLWLKRSYDSI